MGFGSVFYKAALCFAIINGLFLISTSLQKSVKNILDDVRVSNTLSRQRKRFKIMSLDIYYPRACFDGQHDA